MIRTRSTRALPRHVLLGVVLLAFASPLVLYLDSRVSAAAAGSSATSTPAAGVKAFMTLYGFADNSPPGKAIDHPCLHRGAGGTGTYTDPITFATDVNEEPWCTIIYVPYMERYFIHEDECSECDADWNRAHLYRFDMWAGGDALSRQQPERRALLGCESTWTRGNSPTDPANPTVFVNPPKNLPVTTDRIFSPPGACWRPITVSDPGAQISLIGSGPVELQISATDSSPGRTLSYVVVGLPQGLSLDPKSGLVAGAPFLRQRTRVTVSATDGSNAASVNFRWVVKAPRRR